MASLRKHPGSSIWQICYRTADGSQRTKTTGLPATGAHRVQAMRMAEAIEQAARDVQKLTKLRKVTADVMQEISEEARPPASVRDFCTAWLEGRRRAVAASTLAFYNIAVDRFLKWLRQDAARDMMGMTRRRLEEFRDHLAAALTADTANHNMKILRMIFRRARLDGVIFTDPAEGLSLVKVPRKERRRPFTIEEIRAVLSVATGEWRGLVLFGLHTGQRPGDLRA